MLHNTFSGFKTFKFTHSQPFSFSLSLPPWFPSQQTHIVTIHTLTGNSEKGKREETMATRAAEVVLRCVFDGCFSMQDMEIERRPYHRNCSCALHNLKGVCSNACSHQRKISFPKKQLRTCYSLSTEPSKFASQCSLTDESLVRNKEDAYRALSYRQHSFLEASHS